MQSRKEKSGYWLVLEKGEEMKSAISGWAKEQGISGAQVWGIGGIEDVELGYFNLETRKYDSRKFAGLHELLSCIGNINEDGLHAHVSISDSSFNVYGGHLLSAKISVFGEFFVLPTSALLKKPAPEFGLKRINL